MTALLEVEDLTVRFGDHVVVDQVSFTLDRGARLGIIGESGSGKTLTALSVIGLVPDFAAGQRIRATRRSATPRAARQ